MRRRTLLGGASALALLTKPAAARFPHGGAGIPPAVLTITGITLSNASFTGGSSSGTVVGSISVTMTGGSFSGSLSLTGADAASFQIVGTNLETNGVVANGSYAINIVATQGGAIGSPFSQPETITGSSTSIAGAFFPTTNVLGGDYIFVALRFTGSAPASITSATWSGGGGSGTVLSGSFSVTGKVANVAISTPSPGSTTSYDLALTTNLGTTATLTGISVLKPVTDIATGIYGPTVVYWDLDQPFTQRFTFSQMVIATYFTRGLYGPLTVTLTDTVGGSGDALAFSMSSKSGGFPGGLSTGFNLCVTNYGHSIVAQPTFAVTVNISNGITTQSLAVTINRPATKAVSVYAWMTVVGGAYSVPFITNQLVLDTTRANSGTTCDIVQLLTGDTGITFTPDSGGLFSFTGGSNGTVQVDTASLIPANYGHHTCTIKATTGPSQTLDFWIAHTKAPVVAWQPNDIIYSSTPATTGFLGSNLIGTIAVYSDEHGQITTSSSFRFEIMSDSSGALEVWNTGQVYLTAPVSVGTIDAVVRITSQSAITQLITLSLPVLAGTTLASSNITPTISGALTNFVPYANPQRNGSTSFPYGTPVSVGTFTVAGFSNPIDWGNVQTALVLGSTFDNAQVFNGGDLGAPGNTYNIPRYIVAGSGTSGTITATNLSAINKDTPQVDTLRIQLTDGLGTYCTKDIPITVSWKTPTTPTVTVGSGGDFATFSDMGLAFWTDFNANGAASTYAGTTIKVLAGADPSLPWYGPGGGGSGFSNGWMPFPVQWLNDTSTQWTGNGTISGTTLTVNSTSSGALKAGDYLTSGVGSNKVMIMSGSGSTWTVHVGPDPISLTLSAGPASMTTKTPRTYLPFAHTTPGGGTQGGLIKAGYDTDIRGFEIDGVTLAYDAPPGPNIVHYDTNAAGIYLVANRTGNLWVQDCYIHECDVGILNGGPGNQVTVTNTMIMQCGNHTGTQHNIYTDTIAYLTFTNNQCSDTLVGHEFKTRAMQAIITDNVFGEGPNGAASCPINYTFGGNMQFQRNIVTKTVNDNVNRNSIYHQIQDELNGGQGDTGDSLGWTWPYQNNLIDSCTYFNLIPRATAPFQDVQLFTVTGTHLIDVSGPAATGFNGDPIRNTPLPALVTNSAFGNFSFPTEYAKVSAGGVAPTFGSGNTTTTNFPASAIRLIDPITGTPPFRLPKQGPCWSGVAVSTIGSSPDVYYMSLTVPSGSGSGTNVIGGQLTAYDLNKVPMTGTTYSFDNTFTTDNASFTFSTTATGIQLKTSGSLADGLYLVTLQCVGTGYDGSSTSASITSVTSFRISVGNYV
jgi:hypothetical protein